MSFQLKVLSGPLVGRVFPVRAGLTFGRRSADITLDDGRVSTRHAQIEKNSTSWRLVDQGSKNGIRDGKGQKVASVNFTEGARFAIGESEFEVLFVAPAAATPAAASPDSPRSPRSPRSPARAAKKAKKPVYWHEALATYLNNQAANFHDQPRDLAIFQPAIVLKFLRGPQIDTRWVLGFGPRQIGPGSFDLPLWEANLPPICFHLQPTEDGAEFRTDESGLVRLNGQSLTRQMISAGDSIEIRDTLIELDLVE